MARPRKEIDGEQVYKLARLGCTQDEIADFFGVDQATISRRFASEFSRARSACKMSLRRAQMYRAVRDRSDSMLIHLGKQMLGQSDKVEAEVRSESVIFERIDSPRDETIPPPAPAAGVRD